MSLKSIEPLSALSTYQHGGSRGSRKGGGYARSPKMAHGKIPRFLRTALQISLLCTISVSQVFARSCTLVVFSVGNNKLARDQVSDCDLYSTLCIPKRQYLYKAQVGPRELPLRGRGSVKFRCGKTETPSASSMKYRCWGISREGKIGRAHV